MIRSVNGRLQWGRRIPEAFTASAQKADHPRWGVGLTSAVRGGFGRYAFNGSSGIWVHINARTFIPKLLQDNGSQPF